MDNYLVIVNKKIPGADRERLESVGKVIDVPKEKNITELITEEYSPEYKCVAVAGGDGSAGKASWAAVELGNGMRVMQIPYGTGNDIATSTLPDRNLKKRAYIDKCLEDLESGDFETKAYDVIQFKVDNDKEYVAQVGIHFELFAKAGITEKNRFWNWWKTRIGESAYVAKGLVDLISHKPGTLRVRCEGEQDAEFEIDGIYFGQMALCPSTGGKKAVMKGACPWNRYGDFYCAPVKYMEDGEEKKYSKLQLAKKVDNLKDMESMPEVRRYPGIERFTIEGDGFALGYDGEWIGKVDKVEGEVLRGAVQIYTPRFT